jgi:hypothetical protein
MMQITTNGRFTTLGEDMDKLIVEASYVSLNVFVEDTGSVFATDADGNNIENRAIQSVGYTYADETNEKGFLTITFMDNTTFVVVDDAALWYYVSELPRELKPLV